MLTRLVVFAAAGAALAAEPVSTAGRTPEVAPPERISELAAAAMAETGAKGLAVAMIDRGRVLSVQAFGDLRLAWARQA